MENFLIHFFKFLFDFIKLVEKYKFIISKSEKKIEKINLSS